MAGFAQSPQKNNTIILKVKNKERFIKDANKSIPSKEFLEINKKAGKLIGLQR